MSKKLAIIFLALIIGATFFGCAKVAETTGGGGASDVTNVTGSPPAGTTQVKLSCGNVSASSNAISFAVTALNQNNTVLTGMGGGNFSGAVYSSNPSISSITASTTLTAVASLTVSAVTAGGANVSAALVIDKSGSMIGAKMVTAEIAGKLFIDELANNSSNNKAAIVNFADDVGIDCPMVYAAANKQALYDAIDKEVGYLGSTSLYYAIASGIWTATKETASATRVRAVVAMTDGVENWSGTIDPLYGGVDTGTVEVVKQALKYSIPVYTIGLFLDTTTAQNDSKGLKSIAQATSANYFEIITGVTGLSTSAETIRALGIMTDLYQKISQALTQSYSFVSSPSTTLTPGTYWLMLTLKNYGSFSGQTIVTQFTAQ